MKNGLALTADTTAQVGEVNVRRVIDQTRPERGEAMREAKWDRITGEEITHVIDVICPHAQI